jgi:hypothetical protein
VNLVVSMYFEYQIIKNGFQATFRSPLRWNSTQTKDNSQVA